MMIVTAAPLLLLAIVFWPYGPPVACARIAARIGW